MLGSYHTLTHESSNNFITYIKKHPHISIETSCLHAPVISNFTENLPFLENNVDTIRAWNGLTCYRNEIAFLYIRNILQMWFLTVILTLKEKGSFH